MPAICLYKCGQNLHVCLLLPFAWHVSVFVCFLAVTLLTVTPCRPAAEQKVPGGEGSLVRRLRFA